MSIALPAASAGTVPEIPTGTAPDSASPAPPSETPLTLRQEAFCRHYAATGNAAGAARDAGYAGGSARQTGHDLLERPDVAGRVRAIRAAWRAVERDEAQILLGRLEQAWDAAVEQGSASLMIRVVKLQAELSGLDRRSAHRRAGLWPLPGEASGEAPGEQAASRPADSEPGPPIGPLAEAVRRGRHRTERALALHRLSRKALEKKTDFDEAAWLATAQRLHATVEERRPRTPDTRPDRPAATDPDISLHGSLHPPVTAPAGEAPEPPPGAAGMTNPDNSLHPSGGGTAALHPALHRAGLLPAQTAVGASAGGATALNVQAWHDDHHAEMDRIQAEGRPFTDEEMLAYRSFLDRRIAQMRSRNVDFPDSIQEVKRAGCAGFPQPAGEPGADERRAEEKERAFLGHLARTRPPLATGIAGAYLYDFVYARPCRGARDAAHSDGEHDVS